MADDTTTPTVSKPESGSLPVRILRFVVSQYMVIGFGLSCGLGYAFPRESNPQ